MTLGMVFWLAGLAALVSALSWFFGVWAFPAMLVFAPYFWMACRMDRADREEIGER